MTDFRLDHDVLQAVCLAARERAATGDAATILARFRSGAEIDPAEMAVLWYASSIDSATMYELALATRREQLAQLETFSPLYMTNTCDAECRMCGMRRDNDALVRQSASLAEIESQLRLLLERGMRAVALLTGEYRAEGRPAALALVNTALRTTQALNFGHVLINVGSIDPLEFDSLLGGVERDGTGAVRPKLTMCTFQETYSRPHYARFMGTDPDNPRADFERRLTNFDRAYEAGMRVANPGVLVGLNPDLGFELTALALHARHLEARGMEVYLSVPRLRQIAGSRAQRGASDDEFVRLVSILSLGLPHSKIVITTRESAAMQRTLVPIVSVLSAGSAAVTPYTATGARFPLETSQFEVIDQRPFEAILREYAEPNRPIANFHPAH